MSQVIDQAQRDKVIVRTSLLGIGVNVLLAAFKAAVGLISSSIAVILDAVNNLSDALSSVITVIGSKLASRKPDKKHPLGHGRVEYLSATIVSAIVLYAGITALVESIKKIISPEKPSYTAVSLIIIAAAIAAKLLLGRYVKAQGKAVKSGALEASGQDALFDAIVSSSVLASALIYIAWGVSLEAYVGVLIAVLIIKAGVEMLLENVDDILGHRADAEDARAVKQALTSEPEVIGAYDLFINNYGPNRNYASVHLELRDTMTVAELDVLSRRLERQVYEKTGIFLTGISVYSYNTGSDEAAKLRDAVKEKVLKHPWALQVHGFFVDTEAKQMRFDVVLSFDISAKEALDVLYGELKKDFSQYQIHINPDVDLTD